jgi:hypothetical protein
VGRLESCASTLASTFDHHTFPNGDLFMRAILSAVVIIATFVLNIPSPHPESGFHRALPTRALSLARGADQDTTYQSSYFCEDKNLSNGQLTANGCTTNVFVDGVTPCVVCAGDNAKGYAMGGNGAYVGYYSTGDMYSCHGQKKVGVCTQNPITLKVTCVKQTWDNSTYCNGEIMPFIQQAPQGGS